MANEIWVAIITTAGLIVVQAVITWRTHNSSEVRANAKIDAIIVSQKNQCDAIMYRIEQLESKQDKHNCLIERMVKVEAKVKILEDGR
jgi:hypothetical protein